MATATFRDRECRELLAFDEVRHRLGLGTRLPGGRREVVVADIIGSVGRVSDFDGCFRPRNRRLRDEIRARAASPAVVDMPLSLLQVDHAFFVEDGHKRLSAAIADGRRYVDANVDRFETRFHVAPGTTMASIRVTASERRFRNVTGLEAAAPGRRFPLSDPDGYLEQMKWRLPAGRHGEPRELTAALLFLASDASSYVTGVVLPVDGGMLTT